MRRPPEKQLTDARARRQRLATPGPGGAASRGTRASAALAPSALPGAVDPGAAGDAGDAGAAGAAGDVTRLLQEFGQGHRGALDRLWPLVYDALHRLAQRQRAHEFSYSPDSPQTTALVHEAYLRLLGDRAGMGSNRRHFYAIAARVMRHILIDAARARRAHKRDAQRAEPDLGRGAIEPSVDLLALDAALQRLAQTDERLVRIVELRYFVGLTEEETAELLSISVPTVKRDWALARAWLFRALS